MRMQESIDWVEVPVLGEIGSVNLIGLPVVHRNNALGCPTEFVRQVEHALETAGFQKDVNSGVWSTEERSEEAIPSYAEQRRRPRPASRSRPGEEALRGYSEVEIPDGGVEEIAAQVRHEPKPKGSKKAAMMKEVEELEEEAFNLMEHRERVLAKIGDSEEAGFGQMLASGLDNRLTQFREEIVNARRSLNLKFRGFIDTIAKAKASEYFLEHMAELQGSLDSPDDELAERLDEIVGRLQAFGATFNRQTVADAIKAKVQVICQQNTSARQANESMREVLDAETQLTGAIEGLKAASKTRDKITGQAQTQLQQVAGLAFVREVHFVHGKLEILTTAAKLSYEWLADSGRNQKAGKRILDIGEYRIVLGLSADNASINLFNTRYGNGKSYQHPHVSGTGHGQNICWGNIGGSVLKLLKDWDFITLVQLLWNFINSYNSGDSYTKLATLWPDWTGEGLPTPEKQVRKQ